MVKNFSLKKSLFHYFQKRLLIVFLFVCAVFSIFVIALFNLQIIQGDRYRELSLNNVLRYERISAPRGMVYDRHGNVIITNESIYQLYMRKSSLARLIRNEELLQQVAVLLEISPEELTNKYETEYAREILIKNNLSFDELALLEERRHLLPEMIVQRGFIRYYPHGEITGHITGHLSRISRNEYEKLKEAGYTPHSWIGKSGIERQYESRLKGKDGEEIFLRRSGQRSETWEFIPAKPGDTLHLTISLPLQTKAWELLEDNHGSIIVMEPRSGDILAMVSRPSFNPQHFVTPHFFRNNPDYLQKEEVSMLNKSIQGTYPPGSIFKLFTAFCALEENIITPSSSYYCTGKYYYPGWRLSFTCEGVHEHTRIESALKYSCNYFFYEAGVRLGIGKMMEWAQKTGLNTKDMIDLPFEKSSLFPSPAWKHRFVGEGWVPANTLHLSIGQGYLNVTPLRMASFFSLLANRGIEYRPRLLRGVNLEIQKFQPEKVREIKASPDTWRALKEGMEAVVNEEGGTAYTSRSRIQKFAGKTGTAQNPHGKPHAWFAGYAPIDDPQIVIIVLLENKGGGGRFAAPVAKELLEFYFTSLSEDSFF